MKSLGFWSLLTLLLVVFKILGYINYSWLVVFSPIIISFFLGLLILALCFVLIMLDDRRGAKIEIKKN